MTRTRRNNSILCWLLAITLGWLPFAVSADGSTLSANSAPCHEMNSDLHEPAVAISHRSALKKACCDDHGSGNSCAEMSECNNKTEQTSSFIVMDRNYTQSFQLVQPDTKHPARYQSLTSSPGIPPPIV